MEVVWDNEKVFRLIDVYKTQPILWDCSHKDYKDKTKKNEAWEEMSKVLDIPVRDVASKLHILRSQFAREKKRIFSIGPEAAEKTRWVFYDALKFLLGATTRGSPVAFKRKENYFPRTDLLRTSTSPWTPPTHSQKKKIRRFDNNSLKQLFDMIKNQKRKIPEPNGGSKDEFDFYGQYVASELRAVRNEGAVLHAKSYINDILINARMGKFDNSFQDQTEYTCERASTPSSRTSTPDALEFINTDDIKIEPGTEPENITNT